MKVYIIADTNYEGLDIDSVYSTKDKAIEALSYFEYLKEDDIHEYELDPIYKGEKYENYFYCNFKPSESVTKVWGGTTRIKPSDFTPFKFIVPLDKKLDHTQGFGKTSQEAEANAMHAQTLIHPVWQVFVDDEYKNDRRWRAPHPSVIYPYDTTYAVHEDFNIAKIAVMEYQASGKLSPFLTVVP